MLKRKDSQFASNDHFQKKRNKCEECNNPVGVRSSHRLSWTILPAHILTKLFIELGVRDLAQCSLVCSYWHDILKDDYVWKHIFKSHWKVNPGTPIRMDCIKDSWHSEYKRLHLLEHGTPLASSSTVHSNRVCDLTFSRSGKYLCTSSSNLIVMWTVQNSCSGEKQIEVFNKLYFSINCQTDQCNELNGIAYTIFNETDEYLLVNGRAIRLDTEGDKEFHILIYTFPACFLLRAVQWLPLLNLNFNTNPGWFGRATFITSEPNEAGYEGVLKLYSVFETLGSKELLHIDYDIEDVAVINDRDNLEKVLVFCYIDNEVVEDYDYCLNSHNISTYVVTSELTPEVHVTCDTMGSCCVESRYWSSDPKFYTCVQSTKRTEHIGAAIRQVDDGLSQSIGVVCRPYSKTPDSGVKYSDELLDLRVYDLRLNLLRVVPLQSIIPPKLYMFEHDYWIDRQSVLISGDLDPGILHYFDLHYNIHIRKDSGHTEAINCAGFSPTDPKLLCTVSDDNFVKFWDLGSYDNL